MVSNSGIQQEGEEEREEESPPPSNTKKKGEKIRGFPHSLGGKESTCNAGDPVRFLGGEDPLEKGEATHSSILDCIVHGVAKSQT